MTDLLPCPFCGGTADPEGWLSAEEDPVTGDALRRGPECNDCGATADSAEAWNKRPFASFVHIHKDSSMTDNERALLIFIAQQLIQFSTSGGAFKRTMPLLLERVLAEQYPGKHVVVCTNIACDRPAWCKQNNRCTAGDVV